MRVIEAVLQSGAEETRYVRAGEGDTVLLVLERSFAEIARSRVFLELAERRRVIAAARPAGAGDAWLRGLIDGLGLERPELVGDQSLSVLLRGFAEAHPDRIGGVTLLEDPEPANDCGREVAEPEDSAG